MPRPMLSAALAVLLAAAGARAGEPPRVAFLGLRPTGAPSLEDTAIAQLPEAQRLRAVAEEAVKVVSGAPVLRHEELRAALAPTYLVDLFDCRGETTCQVRVAAPLGSRGVVSAVVGDYHAGAEGYRVRLRRFDLAKARLVEEATFLLPRDGAESVAPWRIALAPLFQDTGAIRIVTNVPDASCALDGRPCHPTADGLLARIPEGEHLLELSKDGYRRTRRVVVVNRREEVRVAIPLEEGPAAAQEAPPDPGASVQGREGPAEAKRPGP